LESRSNRLTCTNDLEGVTDDIETKYYDLQRRMEEAKRAQANKKSKKLLR